MIFVIKLKRHIANASIFGIIVNKFCHRKKLYPIILLKVDKNSEINFHHTDPPFSLAVRLQIKGNGKFLLNA